MAQYGLFNSWNGSNTSLSAVFLYLCCGTEKGNGDVEGSGSVYSSLYSTVELVGQNSVHLCLIGRKVVSKPPIGQGVAR